MSSPHIPSRLHLGRQALSSVETALINISTSLFFLPILGSGEGRLTRVKELHWGKGDEPAKAAFLSTARSSTAVHHKPLLVLLLLL